MANNKRKIEIIENKIIRPADSDSDEIFDTKKRKDFIGNVRSSIRKFCLLPTNINILELCQAKKFKVPTIIIHIYIYIGCFKNICQGFNRR